MSAQFSLCLHFSDFASGKSTVPLVLEVQLPLCTNFSDFATDSVTVIGLLGTSSGTQWVILLYWVPPDSVLLRFCVTEPVAELFPYGKRSVWPYGSALIVFPYGERPVWPYGSASNVFTYGERPVCPYGSALNVFPYGKRPVWPYGSAHLA